MHNLSLDPSEIKATQRNRGRKQHGQHSTNMRLPHLVQQTFLVQPVLPTVKRVNLPSTDLSPTEKRVNHIA